MSRYNPTPKKLKEMEEVYLLEAKKDKEDFLNSTSTKTSGGKNRANKIPH